MLTTIKPAGNFQIIAQHLLYAFPGTLDLQ